VPSFTPLFLTIHVLTAIVAFGPIFGLPLIARMAAQEPQHGLFALRATNAIQRWIVIPAALTMPISGGLLMWSEGIDLPTTHWLVLAIGLYLITITFAVGIQLRTIGRMIQIAGGVVAAGPVLAAGPGADLARPKAAPGTRDSSPAAEMAALAVRARNGGFFLLLMVVVIVSLMAGKPSI
jgi:Predicted integral membrane protein (DUF2269)